MKRKMKLPAAPHRKRHLRQAGSPLRSDKLRGIKAKLRRSQPGFALTSFAVVRLAIHPCNKLQGILAKMNKKGVATEATPKINTYFHFFKAIF